MSYILLYLQMNACNKRSPLPPANISLIPTSKYKQLTQTSSSQHDPQ